LILASGLTLVRNRTWSDADRFARTLVASAPNSAKVHYTLAGRLQSKGSLDEALDELDVAVSIYPSYAEGWNRMGAIQHERRDYRAAVESLRRATTIFPGFTEALYRLGNAHQSIGELDEAAEAYRGALALDPKLVEALTNLGSVYARTGRLDEAERLWVEALELSPGHDTARANLDRLRELRRP
jgi:tetratricopeptide (TPR) repeat protein